jgi:hypothetical protein
MYLSISLLLVLLIAPVAFALYGAKSDVVQAGDSDFKKVVLKDSGVVIVERRTPQ